MQYKPGVRLELNDTALALCYTSAKETMDVVCKFRDIDRLVGSTVCKHSLHLLIAL